MKILKLIAFFIFFGLEAAPAQKLIKAVAQDWVGGACCTSGTRYYVTFEMEETELDLLKLERIHLAGQNQVNGSLNKENPKILQINFGITTNHNRPVLDELSPEELQLRKHLEEARKDETLKGFEGAARIFLSLGDKNYILDIASFEAAPKIAYP